jgi:GNAT superfamily N-acetyltransferase
VIIREFRLKEKISLNPQVGLRDGTLRIRIRYLEKDDLPALEWDGVYIHYRRLYLDTYKSMCAKEAVMWVVDHEQMGIIGQLFVQLKGARRDLADGCSRAYINAFRLKPPFRSLGIGSKLLRTVEEDIALRNFEYILLNVGKNNPDAHCFYERHGYSVIGDEPGNWSYIDHEGRLQHVSEPSWRMSKRIFKDK